MRNRRAAPKGALSNGKGQASAWAVEEDGDVALDVGFVELRAVFGEGFPTRSAGVGPGQQQFLAGVAKPEMADVCAGQSTTVYDAVARHSGPAGFDKQRANAEAQCDKPPHHRRSLNT